MKTKIIFTCPECGNTEAMEMPLDRCVISQQCNSCQVVIQPKNGDCCIFCSYSDTKCPPMQKL